MQAGAYVGNGAVGVIDAEEPRAPGANEVQLDVAYCGVCGSDLHMAQHGLFSENDIIGHEFSGTVNAVGNGVETFKPGDRVAVRPMLGCGHCRYCEDDDANHCSNFLGIGSFQGAAREVWPGGMAPRIVVPTDVLYRLPDTVGLEHGALVEPLAVAHHAVRDSGIRKGDSCVVMGAGPIGIALIIAARAAGAGTIIATEFSPGRAEQAAHFGADHVLLNGRDDIRREVQRLTNGGADVVFEAVGVPGTIGEAVFHAKRGGRIQVVGVCMEPDTVLPVMWLTFEPTIQICYVYTAREFGEVVDLIHAGRIPVDDMISRVESVGEIGNVFDQLRTTPSDIKVLLQPIA